MHTCVRLVCALTLLATPVAAQSTTEDGIRAVLRGDYHAAARILRPIADDAARPDPVAQFFLALVYDSNSGIGDNARACGLFLRASRQPGPFSEQAAALAATLRDQLGGAAPMLCVAEEQWQGGPPRRFDLGPDHRIVFADTSITVTYGDREQRTSILLPPNLPLLPIQRTELTVTRPVAARRHFFQWFGWMPDTTANPTSWTLGWALSEVIEDRWIPIAGEKSLVVVNGTTAPASYDLSAIVRLRVNANGEAEYAILAGPAQRTVVIPWQGAR